LAGFHSDFCQSAYGSLAEQLEDFGSGLEISFLAAIPKGSGLGTSSILAGTILGALADFASLGWDRTEVCNRTLALEQLLTTGGGWQDQYGGVLPGLKLLETSFGIDQTPQVKWLPDMVFTKPEYRDAMLLYYTGVTRIAKNLLSEIVEGMFLNEHNRSQVLKEMLVHARETADVIQAGDYAGLGKKVAKSWALNNRLDADTNNAQVQRIIEEIDDLSLGYKLPGAGGGGYLFILAKDPDAAREIRRRLQDNPPNKRARFVEMAVSQAGLQISRS
jgi:galactokinase/mevalonate kinase-like predicted kinase